MLKKIGYEILEEGGKVTYYLDTLGGIVYMRFKSQISKIDTITPMPNSTGGYLSIVDWENSVKTDKSIKKIKY